MVKPDRTVLIVGALVGALLLIPGTAAQELGSQDAIAKGLLSTDPARRDSALRMVRALGPSRTSRELRTALITALERENALIRARDDAARRGEALPNQDPDFYMEVTEAVASLRDPRAIPALVGVMETGLMVMRALVDFGDAAAPSVIAVVVSPSASVGDVTAGLWTLKLMLQSANARTLSDTTLRSVRAATTRRLTGRQFQTVLWNAIDVAAELGGADLRPLVERLAFDPQEVAARGITDPLSAGQTARRAAAALDRWPK